MSVFEWPVQVYYEDTDAGGVVYYANYLRFLERARTEWLRAAGFEQDHLRAEHGILFVVRSVDIQYKMPAKFNDKLTVTIDATTVKRASMEMQQSVLRKNDQQSELIASAHVNIVCVANQNFSPCAIPSFIISQLN